MAHASNQPTTRPLFSMFSDQRLRDVFHRANRDLGNEFAVPAPREPVLTGGEAANPEPVEA